jgi:hypothetical protein
MKKIVFGRTFSAFMATGTAAASICMHEQQYIMAIAIIAITSVIQAIADTYPKWIYKHPAN